MSELETRLSQVDPESRKFIKWALGELATNELLTQVIKQFTDEAREWLLAHKGEIPELLLEKMIKGAREHGPPIHTAEKLEEELRGEWLDLIGWSLIRKYNKQRNR